MEFPEKVWVVDPKVNGQHAVGYDFFGTEEEAYKGAIKRAYEFIGSLGRNYQWFAFKPKENSAEVYVDDDTYSWEWSEFALGKTIKEIYEKVSKNDSCCN